jgi:hypothetical protein
MLRYVSVLYNKKLSRPIGFVERKALPTGKLQLCFRILIRIPSPVSQTNNGETYAHDRSQKRRTMLTALTSGKAGTLGGDFEAGTSWREVFRASEDLLTASVFGRLTYLDGPVLWRILRRAVGGGLPDYKVVELLDAAFWPRFDEADGSGYAVEPDIVLKFQVGDPSKRIDIIVEAKLGTGATQYAEQWRREWTAVEKSNREEGDVADAVFLMAVGGLGTSKTMTVGRIVGNLADAGHAVNAVAATWTELADAVHVRAEESVRSNEQRLLGDIIAALALANYRHVDLLGDLRSPRRFREASVNAITRYDFKENND